MKMKFNKALLKDYLKQNNLTQAEFVRKLSRYVPTAAGATVKHWLDGGIPSDRYLVALSKILETDVSNLIFFGK